MSSSTILMFWPSMISFFSSTSASAMASLAACSSMRSFDSAVSMSNISISRFLFSMSVMSEKITAVFLIPPSSSISWILLSITRGSPSLLINMTSSISGLRSWAISSARSSRRVPIMSDLLIEVICSAASFQNVTEPFSVRTRNPDGRVFVSLWRNS